MRKVLILSALLVLGSASIASAHDGRGFHHEGPPAYAGPQHHRGYPPLGYRYGRPPQGYYGPPPQYYGPPPDYYDDDSPTACVGDQGFRFCFRP